MSSPLQVHATVAEGEERPLRFGNPRGAELVGGGSSRRKCVRFCKTRVPDFAIDSGPNLQVALAA